MKRLTTLIASLILLVGCHKADQPEKPKHVYILNAVIVRKYVVEGNYEVILKRIGGSCPRELLDMKMPVSFPVEPDLWANVVDHNRMVVLVTEYALHTEIQLYSLQIIKMYDRQRRS